MNEIEAAQREIELKSKQSLDLEATLAEPRAKIAEADQDL